MADLGVELVVHHPVKAPCRVAGGRGGQAVLLDVDSEDGELGGGQLALLLVSAGGEEDAQPGLVVDGLAGGVSAAGVDTVGEHEGTGLRVEHVGGSGVDVAGDHLEADEVLWTFLLVLARPPVLGEGGGEQAEAQE